MPQLDTGLGWAADSLWLKYDQDAVLAELGGFASSLDNTQPLPQISDPNEVYAKGKLIANRQNGFSIVYAACAVGTEGIVFISSEQNNYVQFFSPNRDFTLYIGTVLNGNPQSVASYTGTSYSPNYQIYGYIGTAPIYYSPAWAIYIHESEIINIPRVTKQAMFDSLSLDTYAITKSTEGYAVAALAKWKTGAGAVITTPVLISTESEYADMSASGGSYNLAKLNILHLGRRFYMSFFDIADGPNISSILPVFDKTDEDDPALTLENVFKFIASVDYAHITVQVAPDPYEDEGEAGSEEGGGGEELEDDDAGIEAGSDFPAAINTGFCRIFTPSESDLRNLSNYLWSNSYDLAQVKKLFSNPMDSILGLSAVPIRLLGSSANFSLGGVPITGMTLPMVTQQRYTYHMGTITIKERWGSYLDYDPYTKFSIFLPFIGMRELAADDIMGKTVSLVYDIDILTGMCVARLQAGTNCLYEWGGNCAIQLPINSRNWDSVFSTAVSAVGGIMSAVSGGSAPLVAGSVASAALQTVSMKPHIDKSSMIGGAAGWLGQMTPYIIRATPEAFIPNDQNKFIGYPAYINVSLGGISGYNEVESIHLENIPATGAELDEIETILKGGAIF